MNFYVLSTRRFIRMPSNGCAFELENLLVDTCAATLITPDYHQNAPHLRLTTKVPLDGAPAERVLLVVALWTDLARVILAIPRWREEFGVVAAYVMDPWVTWSHWPEHLPKDLDCFFVPDTRAADQFRTVHGVNAHPVPMAADVLRFGSNRVNRPLDLVAYGRQHPAYVQVLEQAFNDPCSNRFMYHDTLAGMQATSFQANRRLIWKLLHKSRCSLAFDTLVTPDSREGDRHRSIIPLRYYEAITAGTAIVGIHPVVPEMKEQFGWPDATIGLPDSPRDAPAFLEDLLEDTHRLNEIHQRNHMEAWRRHDWRYRIRDMLGYFQLPLPAPLVAQLSMLDGPPVGCEAVPW
jgi:hypothetical protein